MRPSPHLPTIPPCRGVYFRLVLAGTLALLGGSHVRAGDNTPAKSQPIVPGFERFYTEADADLVKGGRLLFGELNCTSCHEASKEQQKLLLQRQAPVLTHVGTRVKHVYFEKFLENPHAQKPGTAMPDVFAGLGGADKREKITALAHLLASTGSPVHEALKPNMVAKGQKLFHEVGCVACHGSRDLKGNPDKLLPTSVPLTNLKDKYTLPSLAAFLESPHQSRPSGRMPGLLDGKDAREVASYLLQGIPGPPPNLAFAYFEGTWDKVPNFKQIKPVFKGECSGFDLSLAARANDFALQFEGYLKVQQDGNYRFWLNSDDGSQLWIDGKLVVNNDGVHAPQTKSGTAKLTKGMHQIQVGFFQVGGGVELQVDIEGPQFKRQSMSPHVFLTPQGNPVAVKPGQDESFAIQPELVAKGKTYFAELGCASCHQLKLDGKEISSKLAAPALDKLKTGGGCLSTKPAKGAPHFELTAAQAKALGVAIKNLAKAKDKAETVAESIHHTFTAFNCYACHTRNQVGGVEQALSPFFKTAQPEMGEEGRLPPPLDGVGAKMKKAYLEHILADGSHDRPYMFTRMPKFGKENTSHLVEALASADTLTPIAPPAGFNVPLTAVKKEGRHMVGARAFGCIKCHTFAGHKAEGVQGMDMTLMTERVNHSWFHQYLINPQKFRPGTRMPSSWPGGQTQLPKVLGGDTAKQIEAIWVYLADGKKASLPLGTSSQFIELIPDKSAILYRNFIAGGGSRAIGVGYPEHGNVCFDANKMALALIWQGAFMDAGKHWNDRGVGYQPPLGENVLNLPTEVPFAVLTKDADPWPTQPARSLGYKFHGYTLTADDRPTFRYAFKDLKVEDFPNAVAEKDNPSIQRKLTLSGNQPAGGKLYYRAAVAGKIEKAGEGLYSIDGKWKIRIESSAAPVIRMSSGRQELLVPVEFKNNQASILQHYAW